MHQYSYVNSMHSVNVEYLFSHVPIYKGDSSFYIFIHKLNTKSILRINKMISKFIIFSSCYFFISLLINVGTSDPIQSCNQTPYPQVCTSLTSTNINDQSSQFRTLVLQATMNKFISTHQVASSMSLSPVNYNEQAMAAWNDCLFLMEDTISHLSNSISSSSYDDSQTWLSAAIANHETCKNGFIDFDTHSNVLNDSPFMMHNISESLSNALSVNKATYASSSGTNNNINRKLLSHGFPSWVSAADRKLLQSSSVKANLVVAQDGSGNYKTISEAVQASVSMSSGASRFVIYIKAGTYNENVAVSMKNLMFVGDGIDKTVVTGSKNVQDGSTTFNSATVAVTGSGFIAQDMTFQNTAGPQKHQAVALRSGSDLSIFYRCSFQGYQDTLYVYSMRQFYSNCDIYGTVDFIFGDAVAIFQSCNMYVRKPMSGQMNTVTAQGRSDPNENTGISIINSNIAAAEALGGAQSYLGRPWQQYSRTVVIKTVIGSLIDPAGWLEWSGNFALNTLYYGEYMNSGPGSGTGGRVNWPGFHIMTATDAAKFTVNSFLGGGSWIAAAGVPYSPGL